MVSNSDSLSKNFSMSKVWIIPGSFVSSFTFIHVFIVTRCSTLEALGIPPIYIMINDNCFSEEEKKKKENMMNLRTELIKLPDDVVKYQNLLYHLAIAVHSGHCPRAYADLPPAHQAAESQDVGHPHDLLCIQRDILQFGALAGQSQDKVSFPISWWLTTVVCTPRQLKGKWKKLLGIISGISR